MDWGATLTAYGCDEGQGHACDGAFLDTGDIAEADASMEDGTTTPLRITALGGSIPTPDDQWLEAPLMVVRHLDALDTLDATGHIVLFNRPMDPLLINTGRGLWRVRPTWNGPATPRPGPWGCWFVP